MRFSGVERSLSSASLITNRCSLASRSMSVISRARGADEEDDDAAL
jgi:hypothetical protein